MSIAGAILLSGVLWFFANLPGKVQLILVGLVIALFLFMIIGCTPIGRGLMCGD